MPLITCASTVVLGDLLLCLALLWFAAALAAVCIALGRLGDAPRRLLAAHATVFPRAARLGLESAEQVYLAVTRRERGPHVVAAFVALLSLAGLLGPPVLLALHSAHAGEAYPASSVVLGIVTWSAVVELPGQLERWDSSLRPPPLAAVAVVLVLDVVVAGLATCDVFRGAAFAGAFHGAATVALPDLVSALLGVADAASDA